MPLNRQRTKAALKANIATLMGEVGRSPHVQSPQQALAVAYSIKRGKKRTAGRKP